jgi:hypothetical protein
MFANPIQDLNWFYINRRNTAYLGTVVMVTDSMRFKGEALATMAGSAPNLVGCCFPVKHIDRDKILGTFPTQVRTAKLHTTTRLRLSFFSNIQDCIQ